MNVFGGLNSFVCELELMSFFLFNYLVFYFFIRPSRYIVGRTEFGYKLVCCQLVTTHYVTINKIVHVYFSHMTYLMSHVTSLNNTCG